MSKLFLLLFGSLLVIKINSSVVTSLQDVIDDTKKELEELRRIVEGDILQAHDEIHNLATDFFTRSDNVIKDGEVSIQQENEAVLSEITTLQDLAHSAGKEIYVCTDIRLGLINRLVKEYDELMEKCVADKGVEVRKVVNDAQYIVDTSINKVHRLEDELQVCGDQVSCVEQIRTEIDLDLVRLPENIKEQVTSTKSLLNTLNQSVDDCSTVNVSEYASDANTILSGIVDCVNKILN